MFYYSKLNTIVGNLNLVTDEHNVLVVAFDDNWPRLKKDFPHFEESSHSLMDSLRHQLIEYFAKKRTQFDLPMKYQGTSFQVKSWEVLQKIPYGKTISYQEQAVAAESPKAVRAVGGANGRNPICILIPCHRVIAKSGKLQGFAADVEIKRTLIDLENS